MKKVNILAGVFAIFIFGWHVSTACQYLMGGVEYFMTYMISGIVLAVVAFFHMIINVIVTARLSKKTKSVKMYLKLNKEMTIQNMSGYFIIGFMFVHPIVIELTRETEIIVLFYIRFVLDVLFYICLIIHLYYALSHLLITFGFVIRWNTYRIWKIGIVIVLVVLLIILILADAMFNLKI